MHGTWPRSSRVDGKEVPSIFECSCSLPCRWSRRTAGQVLVLYAIWPGFSGTDKPKDRRLGKRTGMRARWLIQNPSSPAGLSALLVGSQEDS